MALGAPGTSSSKPFSLNCQRVTWSPTMVRSWICGAAVPAAMARCRYLNSVCRGASRSQHEAIRNLVSCTHKHSHVYATSLSMTPCASA